MLVNKNQDYETYRRMLRIRRFRRIDHRQWFGGASEYWSGSRDRWCLHGSKGR